MQDPESTEELPATTPDFLPAAAVGWLHLGWATMKDAKLFLIGHVFNDPYCQQHGQPRGFTLMSPEKISFQICRRREPNHSTAKPQFQIPLHFLGQRFVTDAMPRYEAKHGDGKPSGQYAENGAQPIRNAPRILSCTLAGASSERRRCKPYQPRATPWVLVKNKNKAVKGRPPLARPFRAWPLLDIIPTAWPWAGMVPGLRPSAACTVKVQNRRESGSTFSIAAQTVCAQCSPRL